MLKIRLKRCGRKKKPSYRIIVIPSKEKRDGRAVEDLGYYNPITKNLSFDKERMMARINQGAQPTLTVRHFLIKSGLL